MLSLKQLIKEYDDLNTIIKALDVETLQEAAKVPEGKVSNNTKGVLHELLVGRHLNNGEHMEKYNNEAGESPKQAHDRLKATMHPNDYKKINARAKSAADDLKSQAETRGHKITRVHWTSKPGDIERSTRIKATQKEDPSDLVIHTHHSSDKEKKTPRYVGVSLKVSDGPTKHIPTSSLGIEHLGPKAKSIFDSHRKGILVAHKGLASATNKQQRKEWLNSNPKTKEDIKARNSATLTKVAKGLSDHLNSIHPKQLVGHIRTVLHAHATPMQADGHEHIKHITYGDKSTKHSTINPGADYEHILRDPKNITVHHTGSGVAFKHKGKTFGRQSIKFDSQSDPLSAIKSAGKTG